MVQVDQILPEGPFHPCQTPEAYGSAGRCWRIDPALGEGFYWIYTQEDQFFIKIHDFCFREDQLLSFHWPKAISITQYDSISGEELPSRQRLEPGCLKVFIGGGEKDYQVLIHGQVPVRSIGIEVTPAYCQKALPRQYPDSFPQLLWAFQQVGQTRDFPAMTSLLHQVAAWRGSGLNAALFYESKVLEALHLVAEYQERKERGPSRTLSQEDRDRLEALCSFLEENYCSDFSQAQLTKIACMGTTKMRQTFREAYGCTITEYVQGLRMEKAQHLLSSTSSSIGEIARSVGYKSASRFSELFARSKGLSPREYRRQRDEH